MSCPMLAADAAAAVAEFAAAVADVDASLALVVAVSLLLEASLAFVVAVIAEPEAELAEDAAAVAESLADVADAAASEAFVVTVVTVTSSFALPAPPVPLNIAIQNSYTNSKRETTNVAPRFVSLLRNSDY